MVNFLVSGRRAEPDIRFLRRRPRSTDIRSFRFLGFFGIHTLMYITTYITHVYHHLFGGYSASARRTRLPQIHRSEPYRNGHRQHRQDDHRAPEAPAQVNPLTGHGDP